MDTSSSPSHRPASPVISNNTSKSSNKEEHSNPQLSSSQNISRPSTPPAKHECLNDNEGGESPSHLSCSCGSSGISSPQSGFTLSQKLRANKRRAFRREKETQFAFYESVLPSSTSFSDSDDDDSCTWNSQRRTSTTVILCKKDDGWLWSQESFFPTHMRDRYSCSLSSSDGLIPSNEFRDDEGGAGRMDEDEEAITVEDIVVTEEEVNWFRT